jgi:hypothetical protein
MVQHHAESCAQHGTWGGGSHNHDRNHCSHTHDRNPKKFANSTSSGAMCIAAPSTSNTWGVANQDTATVLRTTTPDHQLYLLREVTAKTQHKHIATLSSGVHARVVAGHQQNTQQRQPGPKRAMLGESQPRKQTENLAQSQTADAEVPQQCSNRAHKNQA